MRVERVLDGAVHPQHRGAQLRRGSRQLEQADAVLAGDGAPEFAARVDDAGEGGLGAVLGGSIPLRRDDQRVEVAVAGVRDVGDHDLGLGGDPLDAGEHLRDGGARHADVLRENGPEPLERGIGEPAGEEQPRDVLGVGGALHPAAARLGEEPGDAVGELLPGRAHLVDRGEQQDVRLLGQRPALPFGDGVQAHPVDQLQGGGDDPRGRDRGHGSARSGQRREVADDRALLAAAQRPQRDGDVHDDPERALRPHHQRGEVVAGDALRGGAAELRDAAVGQDDGEAEHVVAGDAVLDAAEAARVGGDVAADRAGRHARRVGRVPEAVGGDPLPEVVVDDAGLHHRVALVGVHLEHGGHPLQGQHDAARRRVRAAREPAARTARDDRDAEARGDPHRRDDVVHRAGQDDGSRLAERGPLGVVVAVPQQCLRIREQGFGREDLAQGGDDIVHMSAWYPAHLHAILTP